MTTLFEVIGITHGMSQEQVRTLLTRRRTDLDLAVILSFAVFYGLASFVVARRVRLRFPLQEGRFLGVVATLITSAAVGTAGVLLGEVWSDAMEGFRVGNSHMSYRANRIPWTQHRLSLFVGGTFFSGSSQHFSIGWPFAALRIRRPETTWPSA